MSITVLTVAIGPIVRSSSSAGCDKGPGRRCGKAFFKLDFLLQFRRECSQFIDARRVDRGTQAIQVLLVLMGLNRKTRLLFHETLKTLHLGHESLVLMRKSIAPLLCERGIYVHEADARGKRCGARRPLAQRRHSIGPVTRRRPRRGHLRCVCDVLEGPSISISG